MTKEEVKEQALALGLSGELVPLSSVRPNPKNPRVMRDGRFEKLKQSIKEFPKMLALRPMVTEDDGMVLGGNMRQRALKALGYGWIPKEWVKKASDLTEDERRRFIAIDNESFGEWDMDALANEWDTDELKEWGVDIPAWEDVAPDGFGNDADEIERKKKEFAERMAAGELSEDDPEYQEFLDKFVPKKTTDDCYTPELVYEAVADWVAKEYKVNRANFVRPFYPGGDYKAERYKPTDIVVDNPPFSILAEILNYYKANGVRFFLFAPALTLFSSSSSSTALSANVPITYENGATVNTSFLTNLEDRAVRLRSVPTLHAAVKEANYAVLRQMRKSLPKYAYDHHIVTAAFVGQLSRLGIDFTVPVTESQLISQLDAQKESGKAIYGGGYIVSDRVFAEREKAEREKAEREKAEKWTLSDREREIVRRLNAHADAPYPNAGEAEADAGRAE